MPGGGVYYQGRFHLLYIKMNFIQMLDQVQSRDEPNFLESVRICEKIGCDGISVHLGDDMGKVQVEDVRAIKDVFHYFKGCSCGSAKGRGRDVGGFRIDDLKGGYKWF